MSEPSFNRTRHHAAADLNPWKSMWLHPRQTVRHLISTNPRYAVLPLAMAGGIGSLLGNVSGLPQEVAISLPILLILAVVLGALLGIVFLYFNAWLIRWTGSWIGGRASTEALRTVFAWSTLPNLLAALFAIVLVVALGGETFDGQINHLDASPALMMIFIISSLVSFAMGIWSFVLMVGGVAEVQGFTILRAIGNLFLPALLFLGIAIVFMIIAILIAVATGAFTG